MVRNVARAVADGGRALAGVVVSALGGPAGCAEQGAARRSAAVAQQAAPRRADHVLLPVPPDDGGLLPDPALFVGGTGTVCDRHRGSDHAHVPDPAGGGAGSAAAVSGHLAAPGCTRRDPLDSARVAGAAG